MKLSCSSYTTSASPTTTDATTSELSTTTTTEKSNSPGLEFERKLLSLPRIEDEAGRDFKGNEVRGLYYGLKFHKIFSPFS